MIKNYKSGDSANNIMPGYGKETRELGRLSFNTDFWGKIINKIKSCVNGTCKLFEFEDSEYDDLKVKVDIGGRERTVSIYNIENLSMI